MKKALGSICSSCKWVSGVAVLVWFFGFFEIGFCQVVQAGLEPKILLPKPPKCSADYRSVSPYWTQVFFIKTIIGKL
jgi:hypothetical protein